MEKITEIWNNRKTRGIIFIIFYILLFSYIFIVYGKRSEKVILPEGTPPKIEKKVYVNYEYEYKLEDKIIKMIKYNDIVTFELDEINYYYINGKTYKLIDEKLILTENPLKYNFDYLNNLDEIKKLSSVVKSTKYADGTLEENYDINLSQLLNVFGIVEEVDANEMTNYSIYLVNEEVDKIIFNDLAIEIKYTNFKNIPEININYDFYESED